MTDGYEERVVRFREATARLVAPADVYARLHKRMGERQDFLGGVLGFRWVALFGAVVSLSVLGIGFSESDAMAWDDEIEFADLGGL